MFGLSMRPELSISESRIRSALIKKVSERLSTIKMQDLVKIGANLNRMDLFDLGSS
jgi:hypothetical protein